MPRQTRLPAGVDAAAFRLINEWQRDFPLVARPFAHIGAAVGRSEAEVLADYARLQAQGVVSRVGAVFAPRRIGASALAALAAPPQRLDEIAARVSREAAINHNYQREHAYNLWFVVTAPSSAQLQAVVAGIERDTGCAVIVLPLEEEFHIDLGFDLRTPDAGARACRAARAAIQTTPTEVASGTGERACALPALDRALIAALQGGLSLEVQPFRRLGDAVGLSEGMVLERIGAWVEEGLIRRFGVVVRHHELGLGANAMCVWNVPDDRVSALGHSLAREAAVTLCYRRRRALPDWPYNLFCMIHGSARDEVQHARDELATRLRLDDYEHAVLFSCRRFKQTGARYLDRAEALHA